MHRSLATAAACSLALLLAAPASASTTDSEVDATTRRGEAYFHLMKARLALSEGRASEVAREVRLARLCGPLAPLRGADEQHQVVPAHAGRQFGLGRGGGRGRGGGEPGELVSRERGQRAA